MPLQLEYVAFRFTPEKHELHYLTLNNGQKLVTLMVWLRKHEGKFKIPCDQLQQNNTAGFQLWTKGNVIVQSGDLPLEDKIMTYIDKKLELC